MNTSDSDRIGDRLAEDFSDPEYAHAYAEDFLNAWIATQIKVLREQRGLSQAQLAILAEMKQGRISRLEDVNYGSWSISTLKRLARALDVTLTVSFDTFTSKIADVERFSREALERLPRDADLQARHERAERLAGDDTIIDLLKWQRGNQRRGDDTGGLMKSSAESGNRVGQGGDRASSVPSMRLGAQQEPDQTLWSAVGGGR